ncbi:MAG: hydantoinase/oxoprolinase family protein, partial [Acidobacteria bacterium]|nr:hydantoinase/oxoprolinase family protein [Acidobacteriota bacterium]
RAPRSVPYPPARMAPRRIGIDTGGTFTDIASLSRGRLSVHKVPSTPDDPARAVLNGLEEVRGRDSRTGDEAVDIVHGTTVGINAILTGNLARTAFVTNAGFEDLIEIGRQERTDLYDLGAQKPVIPVPRRLRFGVASRRAEDGTRTAKPSPADLRGLRKRIDKSRVEAIAIGLLHSHNHPEDEREIAEVLRPLGLPVTCSGDLLRRSGEFERFTAAILNAATRPSVSRYLERLTQRVAPGRLRLMRSSGGIMPSAEAAEFPARALFSGPAGGVIATRALARRGGWQDVAALDMGGTSTDVCLVQPKTAIGDSTIGGLPLAIPAVGVHTIGCGGGSLARVDSGGALRVGPESAGADPGPACYGKGVEPTVTDAHIALGHMGADTLLQGGFPIDPDRSVRAVEKLAKRLRLSTRKTAVGILEVAEVNMMRALLVITVQRAIDPARIPLVAFGGAGGLHAAGLCRLLDMQAAIVPEHPGAFSAIGLALAGESTEHVVPILRRIDDLRRSQIDRMIRDVTARTARDLSGPGVRVHVSLGLRYSGQGPALAVPLRHPIARTMAREHERLFGFVPSDRALELVEIRVRAETNTKPLPLRRESGRGSGRRSTPAPAEHRAPPIGGTPWRVYRRADLEVGVTLAGPCLIEEFTGAVVVPRGSKSTTIGCGLAITAGS